MTGNVTIERKSRILPGDPWEPIATMPLAEAKQHVSDMETDDWNRFGHWAPRYRINEGEAA